jgi:UDP-N-acetylmuramate: L-alanyl-gamma-D-glutamyl-meso-diaminopimelate ligase
MRNFFQKTYPDSFMDADLVCICEPGVKKNIKEKDKFSTKKLVSDIEKKKISAYHFENCDKIINFLVPQLKAKDLVLIMSNGGFDNIHLKLLANIE